MKDHELFAAKEQGKLLAEAIEIIEKLSKNDIADADMGEENKNTLEVKDLIIKARGLTSNSWWDVLKK